MAQAPSPLKGSLAREIALSLVVKAAALAAIALLLFGADRRPDLDADAVGAALTGDRP